VTKEIFIPSNVLPSLGFSLSGISLTLNEYLWTQLEATMGAKLSTLGGQATVDSAVFGRYEAVGTVQTRVGPAGAIVTLTALDGQPYSGTLFTGVSAAQVHAKATLGATTSWLFGNALCAAVTGALDIENVGAYSVLAYAPGVGALVNQSAAGAAFTPPAFHPTPECVAF
jgi:hypothetical protein